MKASEAESIIGSKFQILAEHLTERARRLWAAAEAAVLGQGGVAIVARATGLARNTVISGLKEINAKLAAAEVGHSEEELGVPGAERVRKAGAGRKTATERDPDLTKALESLIEPGTRGDPESPLRWTLKSTRKLAKELTDMGHKASPELVRTMLKQLGYSLQANSKTIEGGDSPDRDEQLRYIDKT